MTVNNAIRFNQYSGAIVCDEERTVYDVRRAYSMYKARPIIPERIQREQGIVAAAGSTGTASIGEELKTKFGTRILKEYEEHIHRLGESPSFFKSIGDVARMLFDIMCEMKSNHVDELLKVRFGFTTDDLIRGYTMHGGEKIPIEDRDVVRSAERLIAWRDKPKEMNRIFINRAILIGYDPVSGFQIFLISMRDFMVEPVQFIFQSVGSGADAANMIFTEYAGEKLTQERRNAIDRVEGLITAIRATNASSHINTGVGGYYNIILIDGSQKDYAKRICEISDYRTKLASEIVRAHDHGFLSTSKTCKFIDKLFFKNGDFQSVEESFFKNARNTKLLKRLLRGYKVKIQ